MSNRHAALESAVTHWDEALNSAEGYGAQLATFGITEVSDQIEDRVQTDHSLTPREARTLSNWGFRQVVRGEGQKDV